MWLSEDYLEKSDPLSGVLTAVGLEEARCERGLAREGLQKSEKRGIPQAAGL